MLCISGCTSPSTQPVTTTVPTTIPPTAQPTVMTTQTVPQTLTGVTWYLVAFNSGTGSLSVKPGTQITAFFDTAGKVAGSAGCNQYTASYQATLNGLSIGAPATTKMACSEPAGIMTQETAYLMTIQGASGYSISGNTLTVTDSGGKAILTYSTVPPYQMTAAPMTGTMWYLNSLVDEPGNPGARSLHTLSRCSFPMTGMSPGIPDATATPGHTRCRGTASPSADSQ